MLHLRLAHGEKLGTDNFLALGLIGLSFGLAEAVNAIGFVAVFAAGTAVRGIERRMQERPPETIEVKVGDPAEEEEAIDPERPRPSWCCDCNRSQRTWSVSAGLSS